MPFLSAIGKPFNEAIHEVSNYQCLSKEIRTMYFDIDTYNADFLVEFFKWLDNKNLQNYYWVAGYTNDEKVFEQAKLIHPVLKESLVLLKDSGKRFSIHVYIHTIFVNMKRTEELVAFIRKYRFKVCLDLSVYNSRQLFRHPFFNKTYTFKKENQCAVDHGAGYHVKGKSTTLTHIVSNFVIDEFDQHENCVNLLDIFKEMQEKGLFQFNPNDSMQSFVEEEKNKELLKQQEKQDLKEMCKEILAEEIKAEGQRAEPNVEDHKAEDQDFCHLRNKEGQTIEMVLIKNGFPVPSSLQHEPEITDNQGYTAAMYYVETHKTLPNEKYLYYDKEIKNKNGETIKDMYVKFIPGLQKWK